MNTDLFINNEWRPATGAKRFDVINPATEEVAAQVAEADAGDVDAAVRRGADLFRVGRWRKLSGRKRGAMLAKAADILAARLDEVARLETIENGKPFFESKIDVSMTIETLRYYAGWADKLSRRDRPGRRPLLHLPAPRTGRRGGRHRSLELPAQHRGLEILARAGRRMHRGAQARD